jgi:probable rRNA maturation factor
MSEVDFPFLPPHDENAEESEVIEFHSDGISFELTTPDAARRWIKQVLAQQKGRLRAIHFIFCDDEYLLALNQQYLAHETLTDIITFPYAAPPLAHGDIFISIDRVRENAGLFQVAFERELYRVMIHGVLHLCGYSDDTPEEKTRMTAAEDAALALLAKD